MRCYQCKCTCVAAIVSILAGVALSVLYALGFVTTSLIFWAYLAIGIAAIFLAPLYSQQGAGDGEGCFCKHRRLLTAVSIGTTIVATVGLIIRTVASTVTVAIVLGIATFLAVFVLATVVCFTNCLCRQ
ncbi:MAG: hypothetical protein E7393_01910 [Ruminococcaceae bacterium]|nr:hypothetical protein [Oscillospiraceae bacterium]